MKKSKLILIIIIIIVISFPIFRYIEDGDIWPVFKTRYIQKDNKVIYVSKHYISKPTDAKIFKDNRLVIKENNKYGYINEKGKIVIPIKYDMAKDFSEGLAAVSLNGKWFFIDKAGKIIIDCKEDYLDDFSEGVAVVGRNLVIDKTGEILFKGKDNSVIYRCIDGIFITYIRINNKYKYGFFDKTGKLICSYKYDSINNFDNGVTTARINENKYVIDKTGKRLLLSNKYIGVEGFSDGLARVFSKKRYIGFVDKTGKEVIPCVYDKAGNFNEGFCKVSKYGKWGYINKQGKVIIPFKYIFGFDMGDGLALVYTDKKRFMYIDKNNKEVIKLRFYLDCIPFPFCDNIAAVSYISNINIFTTKNNTID